MAPLLTANALISSSLVIDIPQVPSIPGALHGNHMLLHPWESGPETPQLRPGGAASGPARNMSSSRANSDLRCAGASNR